MTTKKTTRAPKGTDVPSRKRLSLKKDALKDLTVSPKVAQVKGGGRGQPVST